MVSEKSHVFVGGDCMSGGAEIVNAAAEGKQAAKEIDEFLKGGGRTEEGGGGRPRPSGTVD